MSAIRGHFPGARVTALPIRGELERVASRRDTRMISVSAGPPKDGLDLFATDDPLDRLPIALLHEEGDDGLTSRS